MNRRKFLGGAAACAVLPVAPDLGPDLAADVIKYGEYQVVTEPQAAVSAFSELVSTASYMQGRPLISSHDWNRRYLLQRRKRRKK